MNRYINLKELTTPQLLEIRRILAGGVEASASKAGEEARKLRKENAELKRESEWRAIVESYNLEWGENSYWLSFATEDRLRWICEKLSNAMKQTALAEKTNSIKIPPIIGARELSTLDTVRQGFNEIRNRRNGDG